MVMLRAADPQGLVKLLLVGRRAVMDREHATAQARGVCPSILINTECLLRLCGYSCPTEKETWASWLAASPQEPKCRFGEHP